MTEHAYDAVIVGGGHNGLVAANYLARGGLKVLVLERMARLGGAAGSDELWPGFRLPYCAYVVHMLHDRIVEELELKQHGFDVYDLDPSLFHPFPDGTFIMGWGDPKRFYQELQKFSEHDARTWLDWRAFWERATRILFRYFLTEPPTYAQVFEDVRGTPDEEVWETLLTVSMQDLLDQYFEHEQVRAHFIQAQDAGDPSAPGSALCIAYQRMDMHVNPAYKGLPKGGMQQVSEAIARSARARGVEIRTGAAVAKIVVNAGEAKGVVLANGEEIRADLVVSNADPKRTYLDMLDAGVLDEGFSHSIENLKNRSLSLKVLATLNDLPDFSRYLGASHDPRYLVATRVRPSVEYSYAAWDDAKQGRLPRGPLMSIQFPSVYDPSLAPPGKHVMSIWSHYYPYQPREGAWATLRQRIAEQHLDILSEYAPNIRRCVIDLTVATPFDIEAHIGMTHGNIRHIDEIPQQMFSRRLAHRSPVKNLYLCGSSTHPGGEVSGGPGYNAARAILKDLQGMA